MQAKIGLDLDMQTERFCVSEWYQVLVSYFIFCVTGNCTAGQMIEGKTCKACPLGTYQDKKWQTKCNRCEDKKTTSKEGATTEDDCFCKCFFLYVLMITFETQ